MGLKKNIFVCPWLLSFLVLVLLWNHRGELWMRTVWAGVLNIYDNPKISISIDWLSQNTNGVKKKYGCIVYMSDVAQCEHFVKILGWSEDCIKWKSFSVFRQNLDFLWKFLCDPGIGPQWEATRKISTVCLNF